MTIGKNRQTERAAVNAFRTLMERHNFIVQEIDGGNDHGEDVYVSFTENMKRTGDTIFVQVKGGRSYKTTNGYRVSIEDHREYWEVSNAPIFCVVQDPDTQELFWANASAQLREARRLKKDIKSIKLVKDSILNDGTITAFALRARLYIAEAGDFHKFLTKISGIQFDITDYLAYFQNIFGEQMIFVQKRNEDAATLLHSDLGWTPVSISSEDIAFTKPAQEFPMQKPDVILGQPMEKWALNDVILSKAERMWVEACFEESLWIRERKLRSAENVAKARSVTPILYTPWQEQKVADKPWRSKTGFNVLMGKFIDLGYELWQQIDSYNDARIDHDRARPREIVWSELRDTVEKLRSLGTPHYYLISNRGRITRMEFQQIYEGRDCIS